MIPFAVKNVEEAAKKIDEEEKKVKEQRKIEILKETKVKEQRKIEISKERKEEEEEKKPEFIPFQVEAVKKGAEEVIIREKPVELKLEDTRVLFTVANELIWFIGKEYEDLPTDFSTSLVSKKLADKLLSVNFDNNLRALQRVMDINQLDTEESKNYLLKIKDVRDPNIISMEDFDAFQEILYPKLIWYQSLISTIYLETG